MSHVFSREFSAGSYESLTVAASAVGFTKSYRQPESGDYQTVMAKAVFCSLETAQIRFRIDGTSPTSSVGHLLEIGQTLTLNNPGDITNFRAIRTGDTSGVLRVTFRF